MSIRITRAGLQAMLIDRGREGYRHLGIGPRGAMDLFAFEMANGLVGNDNDAAVIEMFLPLPEIVIQEQCLLVVTGAGTAAFLNGEAIPLWKPFVAPENSVLTFARKGPGAIAYLAAAGGWQASRWLGSFTTQAGVNASGYQGRALQKDDVVEIANDAVAHAPRKFPWSIAQSVLDKIYSDGNTIRFTAGPEHLSLTEDSKIILQHSGFSISVNSNRMGYRLAGMPLRTAETISLVSSPVDFGTIQLLPDGNLIVLMADHQTTGGYPRIGTVCTTDRPCLAQCAPGTTVKFKMIPAAQAEGDFLLLDKMICDLKENCRRQLNQLRS